MQVDNYTLTEAEESQLHIRAASTTWIRILSSRSPTNVPPAQLEAADAFIAARDDLLEKYAAMRKTFPLLWLHSGWTRIKPLRDPPIETDAVTYWVSRTRISEPNLKWVVLPDFLVAVGLSMARSPWLYTQKQCICHEQCADAYVRMEKAFIAFQSALLSAYKNEAAI